MTTKASAPWRLWRTFTRRNAGDRAYFAYIVGFLALFTVLPAARALWVIATNASVARDAASAIDPGWSAPLLAATWLGCLWLGAARGPVVGPPLLMTILSFGPHPQGRAFAPLLRSSFAWFGIAGALVGVTVCLVWQSLGVVSGAGWIVAIGSGIAAGFVGAALWLSGEAAGARTRIATGSLIVILAVLQVMAPQLTAFNPLGWLTQALSTPPGDVMAVDGPIAIGGLALASIALSAPKLDPITVIEQSRRWDDARAFASVMDFATSTAQYAARPTFGRALHAVPRASSLTWRLIVRDAVGSFRMPARLARSGAMGIAAGALIAVATSLVHGGWALGAFAGVLAFVALGATTDGLRHFAQARSSTLYGVPDRVLLLGATCYPAAFSSVTMALGAAVAWAAGGASAIALASTVGVVALAARLASAVKPALPIALLAPVPTPLGDMGALARITWSADSVLIAAAAGAVAVWTPILLLPLLAFAVIIAQRRLAAG